MVPLHRALALAGALLMAVAVSGRSRPPEPPPAPTGVVVERVTPSAKGAALGFREGDLLLRWFHPGGPAGGERLEEAFAFQRVEQEYAARGGLSLEVLRAGAVSRVEMPLWRWGIRVRPSLELSAAQRLQSASAVLGKEGSEKGVAEMRALAASLASGGRGGDAAWVLARAGALLCERASPEAGEPLFGEALSTAERSGSPVAVTGVLVQWASALQGRDRFEPSLPLFDRALDTLGPEGREGLAAATVITWRASSLWALGRNEEAERDDRRSLEIRRAAAPGSPLVAASLTNMGLTLRERGDLAAAQRLYGEARGIFERLEPGSEVLAQVYNNLGTVAYLRGDLALAESFDLRALAIRERLAPDSMDLARSLNNLGAVAKSRRDLEGGERYLRKALSLAEKLKPESVETASILDNLAQIVHLKGDPAEAETMCRRALDILKKIAPEGPEAARGATHLAELEVALGKLDEAAALDAEAVALKEKAVPGGLSSSYNWALEATLAEARGDATGAEAALRRCCEVRTRLVPGTAYESEAWGELAAFLRRRGDPAGAAQAFDRALAASESQVQRLGGGQEASQGFAAGSADLYRARAELQFEAGDLEGAFSTLERFRAQSLLALLAQRDLDFGADAPTALLVRQRALQREYDQARGKLADLSPERDAATVAALGDRLADMRRERGRLEEELRRASPRYAEIQYPRPLDAAQVRQALPPGGLLLMFCAGPERLWVLAVEREGLRAYAVPLGSRRLALEVSAFRAFCADPTLEEAELRRRGAALRRRLLAPLGRRLENGRTLLLCPDGALCGLPWAALWDGRRYLVQDHELFSVPSATAWVRMGGGVAEGGRIVAFADPAAAEGAGAIGPLPAARDEAAALKGLFGAEAVILEGREALESRVFEEGPRAQYLHFACHGLLDPLSPLDSGLLLAGDDRENGLLQAWEVFERLRLRSGLVVLSACETGLGQNRGGEGVVGLARAFQYAGARCVLSSLWSVSDRSTARLMAAVYRALRSGEAPARGLAKAQRDFLAGPAGTRHPFYWASFQLDGRADSGAAAATTRK